MPMASTPTTTRGRHLIFRGVTIALLAVNLVACQSEQPVPTNRVARDSAGTALIDSRAPVWHDSSGWTIAPEPALTIGELVGPSKSVGCGGGL